MSENARANTERGDKEQEPIVKHQVAQKTSEMGTKGKRGKKKNPAKLNVLRGSSEDFGSLHFAQVPEAGVIESEFEQGNNAHFENGGHPGGQLGTDSGLQTIIEAWPMLSAETIQMIVAMVQQQTGNPG